MFTAYHRNTRRDNRELVDTGHEAATPPSHLYITMLFITQPAWPAGTVHSSERCVKLTVVASMEHGGKLLRLLESVA